MVRISSRVRNTTTAMDSDFGYEYGECWHEITVVEKRDGWCKDTDTISVTGGVRVSAYVKGAGVVARVRGWGT